MDEALKFVALAGVGLVAYSYFGYPVVLILWAAMKQVVSDLSRLWHKDERRADQRRAAPPRVAVVISAYNEEAHIVERLRNLLEADYPAELLTVYVGSDGSTDATAALLGAFGDARVRARVYASNRGKASVLNDLVAAGDEPVIVFSDANAFFEPQAIARLVRHFDDTDVGAVCGELRLAASGGDNQDSLYWRFEQLLKALEGRVGGLLGANGAIYAIRRELWRPLEPDTICDDFCVAMNAAAGGARLYYEPNALAHEDTPASIGDEYGRRLRIGIGNFQALWRHPEYLLRTSWPTRVTYFSHKVLRWLTPHLWLASMLACLPLADDPLYRNLLAVEAALLVAALACYRVSRSGRGLPSLLRVVAFFFALNWAFLIASQRYATGNYERRGWARTARR